MTASDNRLTVAQIATLRGAFVGKQMLAVFDELLEWRRINRDATVLHPPASIEAMQAVRTLAELDALRPPCPECESMSHENVGPCPACGDTGFVPLGVWIATLIEDGERLYAAFFGDDDEIQAALAAHVALPKAPQP